MHQSFEPASCPARYLTPPSQSPGVPTWSGPSGDRDVRLNDAWCRTVGPVVLRTPASPRLGSDAGLDSIAILTWNINVGGGDLPAFMAGELSHRCDPDIEAPARPFHFVLLVQEVYRASVDLPEAHSGPTIPWVIEPERAPGGQLDIVEVAERCGLALLYVPSARNGPDAPDRVREDKGNAILSTLALADPAAIELPYEAGRKVAVTATVRGPGGGRIRVVSVHLDVASTLARTLMSGNGTRVRQGLGMAAALESMESMPTVVGGDFNTWTASETVLRRLADLFPDSPAWDGEPTRGAFPPDHMLFRNVAGSRIRLAEGSYRRLERLYGSDHAARVLWLQGLDSEAVSHSHQVR